MIRDVWDKSVQCRRLMSDFSGNEWIVRQKYWTPHPFLCNTRHGKSVASDLVSSGLDSNNTVLSGISQKIISNLRKVHSLWAWVVLNSQQSNSHDLLQQLHWLPTEYRISITCSSPNLPTYISFCILMILFLCSFTSSNANLLTIQSVPSVFAVHSFSVASPKISSFNPPCLNCPDTFHHHLKTHYFQQAFLTS